MFLCFCCPQQDVNWKNCCFSDLWRPPVASRSKTWKLLLSFKDTHTHTHSIFVYWCIYLVCFSEINVQRCRGNGSCDLLGLALSTWGRSSSLLLCSNCCCVFFLSFSLSLSARLNVRPSNTFIPLLFLFLFLSSFPFLLLLPLFEHLSVLIFLPERTENSSTCSLQSHLQQLRVLLHLPPLFSQLLVDETSTLLLYELLLCSPMLSDDFDTASRITPPIPTFTVKLPRSPHWRWETSPLCE